MHKLDDDTLITANLLRAFIAYAEEEGGNGQHYAVIQRSNREWLDHNPHSPGLEPMQEQFARDVLDKVNSEIAHDGAWVLVFTHPGAMANLLQSNYEYARYLFLFLDADGDIQFNVDWSAGTAEDLLEFSDVLMRGWTVQLALLEGAYRQWCMIKQATDAQPDQTFRRAKGQRRPSQH